MATYKESLVAKAKDLEISTDGTVSELEERIAEFGEINESAKITKDAPEEEKKKKKEVPLAIPSSTTSRMVTTTSLKTASKYIGGWWNLKKGKPFTAPREVVENLRNAGFVK